MVKTFPSSALPLRRRSVWEAADSGILLWRSNIVYLIPFYIMPIITAAIALRLFMPEHLQFVSYLALWWCKPLFERFALHVVSARFFRGSARSASGANEIGEAAAPTRIGELCKGMWQIRRGLVGDLLWRRFSPWRAAQTPIRVLERSGGEQFRLRKRNLASGGLDFCPILTFLCLALEAVLLAGKVIFVIMMMEIDFSDGLNFLWNTIETIEIFIFAAFCFNYILVGSLYVCMGFGLYINSRVEVEGWDLQLLFQKFAVSARKRTAAHGQRGVGAALVLCLLLALPKSAAAEPPHTLPAPTEQHLELLESILESPDFGEYRNGWGIGVKEREEKKPRREISLPNLVELLGKIRQVFGYTIRALAVLAAAGFAGFAIFYWYKTYWKNRRKGLAHGGEKTRSQAAGYFSPESPEALFTAAEDFFRRGDVRRAWAACFAGCRAACSTYRSVSFPDSATEYGCLDAVRRMMPTEAAGFGALVQSWVLFAYGGRSPGDGAFEQAVAYGRSLAQPQEAQ